ncbi:glycosyltransferase [bacterium]|nr:glycosyltransferase [bacterium]
MICLMHGYLLEGSGSNLWTRSMVKNICRIGETVHLLCQENHPERYDFISEAYAYRPGGKRETLLKRETPYRGRCILHKPLLSDTFPVYIWDKYEEFGNVVPMIELSSDDIENYLTRNLNVLLEIAKKHHFRCLLANHAVLMSVVAKRAHDVLKIPYSVLPHGSAIVYAVEKDKRLHDLAGEAFTDAENIFTIGDDMKKRVLGLFPDIPRLEKKLIALRLGVDTKAFRPIPAKEKPVSIERLIRQLEDTPHKCAAARRKASPVKMPASIKKQELVAIIKDRGNYDQQVPDANVAEKLRSVDWSNDKVIIFVGRLMSNKGIQAIIAALPCILWRHPNVKLIIVGHGPLRAILEVLIGAIETGNRDLFKKIIDWGGDLEGLESKPFSATKHFIQKLTQDDKLESYWRKAKKQISRDKIIFTGYLKHDELRHLLPCADLAIFPSMVAEAGPLVFLEAISCGVFPLGTYFSGMAQSIDSTSGYLPDEVVEIMKLRPAKEHLVDDIVEKSIKALGIGAKHRDALHKVAVENYDWETVARELVSRL